MLLSASLANTVMADYATQTSSNDCLAPTVALCRTPLWRARASMRGPRQGLARAHPGAEEEPQQVEVLVAATLCGHNRTPSARRCGVPAKRSKDTLALATLSAASGPLPWGRPALWSWPTRARSC